MTNTSNLEQIEKQWKSIYKFGAIATIITLIGVLLDVVIGNITGGNLSELPQTAIEKFIQFNNNQWLGLYNLDLLNIINQILLIPAYFALFVIHRNIKLAYSLFALIIFLTGTIIFVTTNTALPMLDLSHKYASATSELQKTLYAAAGEAMIARGAHGSPGVFIRFLLPNIAGLIMSFVMLKGQIFNKTTAYLGLFGSTLILLYIILVTFIPNIKNMATAFAMPGGLMLMAWMILFTIKLFKLGKNPSSSENNHFA